MCVYGFANESPNIPSITIWCDRPMPRLKRLPEKAAADSAACAIATGWRGYVGTTAVPTSMRDVARAQIVAAMMASTPKMFANHALAKPSASARLAWSTRLSIVPPDAAISPMPMPMRIGASYRLARAAGSRRLRAR